MIDTTDEGAAQIDETLRALAEVGASLGALVATLDTDAAGCRRVELARRACLHAGWISVTACRLAQRIGLEFEVVRDGRTALAELPLPSALLVLATAPASADLTLFAESD